MILSALARLYDRLAVEQPENIPTPGWNRRPVSFGIVVGANGFVRLDDLRDTSGKKPAAMGMLVPDHGEARTSAAKTQPYFLCDHTAFLLGAREGMADDKAAEYFAHSRALHERLLAGCDHPMARAIQAFFATWTPAAARDAAKRLGVDWAKDVSGANLVFLHDDEPAPAHAIPELAALWNAEFDRRAAAPEGQCLVSGETQPIARLHAGIKLAGTTGNGAPVVSFNADAFTSYGHDQGLNAPVGERTAFAYTTALNTLVARDSPRKLSFGDTTVVFWAEDAGAEEAVMGGLFGVPSGLDHATTQRAETILKALRRGQPPREALQDLDPGKTFYILGIGAPGGSRVSVRFWHVSTFGELARRVGDHHRALAIEPRSEKDEPGLFTLHTLLRAVVPLGKDDNIPGPLAAALARAALTGAPYPPALLALALQRMQSEHGQFDSVSPVRVGVVKACLTQSLPDSAKERLMTLDKTETNQAYRLGRLFAALERAQQLALGAGLNATIKDRYFGAASSSPRAVFPNLLRLAQHHLSKAEAGWLDKLIGDIVEEVQTFPAALALEDQGMFALGYYHQRNDLWRKKPKAEAETPETES